jgi:hypothetical protein
VTIGGVTYSITNSPLNLVPPASNNGITTVQGQITTEPAAAASLQLEKVVTGPGEGPFEFIIDTEDGSGCMVEVTPPGGPVAVPDGGSFLLSVGELAEVLCDSPATITEAPSSGFALDVETSTCSGGAVLNPDGSISYDFIPSTAPVTALCVVQNVAVDDDDPAAPNISVTKVCVGEGFEATFEITVADVTEEAGCGDTVTAVDVEPGSHEVNEAISGDDAGGFVTVIVCSDGTVTEGASAILTVPEEGAADVACVIINSFDSLADLLCPCQGLDLEIDIGNTNTNTTAIDNDNMNSNANDNDNFNENLNANENKNDNKNENTQNQENAQDQNNENSQTNNITSSPEVNIDAGSR